MNDVVLNTDPVVRNYPVVPFGELSYCFTKDILYQTDMRESVEYGKDYFEKYVDLENTEIANKLNHARVSLVEKYCKCVLDIGVGSGEFLKSLNIKGYGYDINSYGINWLKEADIFVDPFEGIPTQIDGVSMWDTLEHMREPSLFLNLISGQYVFVSMPISANLFKVRQSKHYKKNEHYYHYSVAGLTNLFNDNGFELLELSDAETLAGREDILSFVFRRA